MFMQTVNFIIVSCYYIDMLKYKIKTNINK